MPGLGASFANANPLIRESNLVPKINFILFFLKCDNLIWKLINHNSKIHLAKLGKTGALTLLNKPVEPYKLP